LGSIADAQLTKNIRYMILHRSLREEKTFGNFSITRAVGDQGENSLSRSDNGSLQPARGSHSVKHGHLQAAP